MKHPRTIKLRSVSSGPTHSRNIFIQSDVLLHSCADWLTFKSLGAVFIPIVSTPLKQTKLASGNQHLSYQ